MKGKCSRDEFGSVKRAPRRVSDFETQELITTNLSRLKRYEETVLKSLETQLSRYFPIDFTFYSRKPHKFSY